MRDASAQTLFARAFRAPCARRRIARARADARASADTTVDGPFASPAKNASYAASMSTAGRRDARARLAGATTYGLVVSYDGGAYRGFQRQGGDAKTIQDELERALMRLCGCDRETLRVGGSGRTDAGVHATRQYAHFYSPKDLGDDAARCRRAMNGMLPSDVRVVEFFRPHAMFHSRYHATRKTYRYALDARETPSVFTRRYAHACGWRSFDVDAVRAACEYFVGTHDFRSFANTSREKPMYDREDAAAYANTTRTIHRCDVSETPDGLIVIEFQGDGFLYRQVRNMVGALLVVASGKEKPEWIATLLAARDRRLAPTAASARGLFLADVEYPPEMLVHDENWDRFDDDDA